ncbi:sugar-transfer associated ATP-grasp domain-containing protein [Sphingosinicella sp.]|uniref:sugar-transfer associated ATP-grasp domain-containing protein n=1 Tax=Sphingosinicella sp. TaxID=1917971 RepID=UPI0035B115C9
MSLGLTLDQIVKSARRAKAQTGRSIAGQILDMARLRFAPGRIRPEAYFKYRLYTPGLPMERKRRFVDEWARPRFYSFDDRRFYAIGTDKLLFYTMMRAWNLPAPRVIAVIHPWRVFAGAEMLRDADAIRAFFTRRGNAPFFIKRVDDIRGRGAALVRSVDPTAGVVSLGSGETVPLDAFVARHSGTRDGGFVVQELARPHPDLAAVIGDRLATVRVMTYAHEDAFKVKRALLRIPVGTSMTDNFAGGITGNAYAAIDPETGKLVTATRGTGPDQHVLECHPDTGVPFARLTMPDWEKAIADIRQAASYLPGLKFAGWDLAFTDEGPMLIEVNAAPGVILPQLYLEPLMDADTDALPARGKAA